MVMQTSTWWCDECWFDGVGKGDDDAGRVIAAASDLRNFSDRHIGGLKACPVCGSALLEVDDDAEDCM